MVCAIAHKRVRHGKRDRRHARTLLFAEFHHFGAIRARKVLMHNQGAGVGKLAQYLLGLVAAMGRNHVEFCGFEDQLAGG